MSFDDAAAKEMDERALNIVRKIAERAENATKLVRSEGPCDKCSCKHIRKAEVEDTKAMIEAAEFLANRGFGRPSAKESEQDDEKIVFTRKVIYSGAEDA